MQMTAHAETRSIQRSVPHDIIETILVYGRPVHSRGALSVAMDRRALELAASELERRDLVRLERYRGVYVVADGAVVVTVARPTRRRRR